MRRDRRIKPGDSPWARRPVRAWRRRPRRGGGRGVRPWLILCSAFPEVVGIDLKKDRSALFVNFCVLFGCVGATCVRLLIYWLEVNCNPLEVLRLLRLLYLAPRAACEDTLLGPP